ncbi:MAG: dynamin family protein, partial [Gemmataceae bacterium]|nr:dynamin family protein [Gemmataceae bacterium]
MIERNMTKKGYSMDQKATSEDRAEALRLRTLSALRTLVERTREFQLPEFLDAIEPSRGKLEENVHQVLVVGEAKRGKSTFVNALIGRDLLPTNVDIATSQVFRICPAEREAYRLRFEDDSTMAIKVEDLPRYGSQVMADIEGAPQLGEIIRWIEVDVPTRFLPRNVRILDTPGLGALYAAHATITHRFVPHADAVIFVLDSQAPISEPEMRFVEEILKVTPNIFFIQTKIDQFRKEDWQEVLRRNEEILKQRFSDRLTDHRVWPISSTNLRKAAETGDDDYVVVSRHKQLAAALQAFLFRVCGWSRTAEAILLADRQHSQGRKTLEQRLQNLIEESNEKRAEIQRLVSERRRQFEEDWGERGQKQRELLEAIQEKIRIGRQHLFQALASGGDIERQHQAMIDQKTSLKEIEELANSLPAQVMGAALETWRRIQHSVRDQCVQLLVPFVNAADAMVHIGNNQSLSMDLYQAGAIQLQGNHFDRWLTRIRVSLNYGSTVWTFAALSQFILISGGALTAPIFPPTLIPLFMSALWHGWIAATRNELINAKRELSTRMTALVHDVRRQFFEVDAVRGQQSLVDEYFDGLSERVTETIRKIVNQRLADNQAEINHLDEQARLDDHQRQSQAERLRQQLAAWDNLGQEIRAIQAELRELEKIATLAG